MGVLSEDLKDRIRAYLPKYPRKQAATLPALHLVHDEMRTVSDEALVEIAELLDLAPAEVKDTMTFYAFFKAEGEKLGRTRLWVCRGLACMLRGAYELIEHCEAKLGVQCGQTTPDGKISLEFAECIGACDGAPACLRNDAHVMNMTPEKADTLMEELKALAYRLGVGDRIHWPGLLTGPAKWGALKGAEAFILPSHQDSFGVAVGEALGCGTPALITDKVNIWREVKASGAGLVETDSVAGVGRMLSAYLTLGDTQQNAMRAASRACFAEYFDMQLTAAKTLEIFRELGKTGA